MNLKDVDKVSRLGTTVENCDFHLRSLSSRTLKIWDGDRGSLLETYGDRHKYIPIEAVEQITSIIRQEIAARRAEAVAALNALGVEADPTP